MATETTKTDKTEEAAATPEAGLDKNTTAEDTRGDAAAKGGTGQDAAEDSRTEVLADDRDEDLADDRHADETLVAAPGRGGVGAGAAAVVSAGLGLVSITGTSLSEMLRDRKQLIGQIESSAQGPQGGGGTDQITALYGAPWHATAALNGIFAVLAVLVGGVLLALVAKRAETRSWVKAVALGGLVLGAIGLLVSGGMYLDLFGAAPEMPSAPTPPTQ